MPGYAYLDQNRQYRNPYRDAVIRSWSEPASSAALWERATTAEHNATYWEARCLRAEQKMLDHTCEEQS